MFYHAAAVAAYYGAVFSIALIFVLLLVVVLRRALHAPQKLEHYKLLVVLGSGGHTGEMLRLLGALDPGVYCERHYIVAETDKLSADKMTAFESAQSTGSYTTHVIPRSREVGQSYTSSVLTTLSAIAACMPIVWSIRPDVVIVNGPGTCIPVCTTTALLHLFGLKRCYTVFVESICRVTSMSLTGKLLYYLRLADKVVVQWPDLVKSYPSAVYLGRVT